VKAPNLGPRVSVIVPTLNAERYVARIVESLGRQTLVPWELLVVDSESDDETVARFEDAGATVLTVERRTFHHATVRNLAAARAEGEILVFQTQDARPLEPDCLELLAEPLVAGRAAAAFARQVPGPNATPLERFARLTNYPPESRLTGTDDVEQLGSRAYFFSNSFSAIRRDVLSQLGGFPDHTVMNEDMLLAARLLGHGHRVAYVAEARVEHHHDYTVAQTFKRYFDIGAVLSQAADELAGLPLASDGARYVGKLLTQLAADGNYHWIPAALAESATKLVAVSLGTRYCHLPLAWTKRLSMHPQYWSRGPLPAQ
jgi:rhamnosyltransferase